MGTIMWVLALSNILLVTISIDLRRHRTNVHEARAKLKQELARPRSFYDTDGLTGYSYDVVPDILHLVRYNLEEVQFADVIFYRSMYLNHRPKTIMVHCSPCNFTGRYARWLEGIPFTFVSAVFPTKVFGQPIKEENPHHSTDVVRVHALLRHGGIYLDADVFVVQSLRRFLRYEATVSCPQGYTFGNMIMITHKNSRFLRLFMDTYRQFNGSLWDYNSAVVPTERFVVKRPHMFHHVDHGLHTHPLGIYQPHYFPDWRNTYALHTIFNHRYIVPEDPLNNVELNETTLRDYDTAMGEMARSVIFGTSDFVGPEAPVLSVAELAAMKDRGIDLTQMRNESSKPFYVVK